MAMNKVMFCWTLKRLIIGILIGAALSEGAQQASDLETRLSRMYAAITYICGGVDFLHTSDTSNCMRPLEGRP